MKTQQLKLFALVFKKRSFSKVSEKFGLAQPTISSHIKKLETELECNLFDRLGRSIIPTKEAEILYPLALDIIEEEAILLNALKQQSGHLTINIGASTLGLYVLSDLISDFQKSYPTVSFQVDIYDSQEVINSIAEHKVLLGIVSTKLNRKEITYLDFLQDELIAISSLNLIKKDRITLREIIKFPIILREEGSGTRKVMEEFFQSEGISFLQLKVAGIFGSTAAVKQAVKEGLGFSFLSKIVVIEELKHKMLKGIKIPDVAIKNNFYIAISKKSFLPKTYKTFLEHIIAKSKKSNLHL